MNWTALVPIKPAGQRKTRLSARLSVRERDDLAEMLLARTLAAIRGEPRITRVVVLSPVCRADAGTTWLKDQGSSLNAALSAAEAALAIRPLLILFPDLLIPNADDIGAMLDAATCAGVALASDRHHYGTNGVAFADDRPAAFCFGPDSQKRFLNNFPGASVVRRPGLAHDCDTVDDLDVSGEGFAKQNILDAQAT